jgi:hypothetical protein
MSKECICVERKGSFNLRLKRRYDKVPWRGEKPSGDRAEERKLGLKANLASTMGTISDPHQLCDVYKQSHGTIFHHIIKNISQSPMTNFSISITSQRHIKKSSVQS